MIAGTVNASSEAIIQLVIRGSEGLEREIEAIIDTGFSGSLTLPSSVIAASTKERMLGVYFIAAT